MPRTERHKRAIAAEKTPTSSVVSMDNLRMIVGRHKSGGVTHDLILPIQTSTSIEAPGF